jgi:hypothetical protein
MQYMSDAGERVARLWTQDIVGIGDQADFQCCSGIAHGESDYTHAL